MKINKCPQCGERLTEEMVDANMCWECGKILDESLVDESTLNEITEQAREINPLDRKEVKEHKVTTSYNFENMRINKYLGVVSGEIVIGTGLISDFKAGISDLLGIESQKYSHKIKQAKQVALYDMIEESIGRGGNAIIGISYGYVVFAGNMIGISVSGTSVRVEEI